MKYLIIIGIAFFAAAAVIKPAHTLSSIYGTIEPAESGKKVFAIKGSDTVVVVPETGKFSIAVSTAGIYKLYVQAIPPYKDVTVDNINVEEGKSSNIGLITLRSDH